MAGCVEFLRTIQRDCSQIPIVLRDLDGNDIQIAGVEVKWANRMSECKVILKAAPTLRFDLTNPEAIAEAASEQQSEPEELDYSWPGQPAGWRLTMIVGSDSLYGVYHHDNRIGKIEIVRGDFDFTPNRLSEYTALCRRNMGDIIDALEAQRLERTTSCE